jgi:hypothetical protein
MTIGEGMAHIEASQNALQKGQGRQKARREVEEGEAGPSETTAPKARKRAQPKCSVCGSFEHNARKCPCK